MKKLICYFICIVAILFTAIFLGKNYLPSWIGSSLSQKLGVDVFINRFSFTPHTIQVHGLTINNPDGYILNTALKANKILANTSVFTLLNQEIIIDEVVISDLYLGLEFASVTNTSGNWTVIMQNLQNALNTPNSGSSKKLLIKTLSVNNINIDLVFRKNDGKIRHLKPIAHMEFQNISSEGAFPMEQLTQIVMSEVLKKIFLENNLKNMLQNVFKSPTQGVYNSLKSFFSLEEQEEIARPPLL